MIKQDMHYAAECDVCGTIMLNRFFKTLDELKAAMAPDHWEIIKVGKKKIVCCPYHVTETKQKHGLLKKPDK